MSKVNELLTQRLKKNENPSKMAVMAQQAVDGHRSSFSGLFSIAELSENEKDKIEAILREYIIDADRLDSDLQNLVTITSEVKAINNQAALLHGERVKRAQTILKQYRDGAFTAWLIAAYGNRQTPYNLMQYYEFCESMPKTLRLQIEAMPRQAIYTLASREGPLEKKRAIVEAYDGETKAQLLCLIRDAFPLDERDRRKANLGETVVHALQKIERDLKQVSRGTLSSQQKKMARSLLLEILALVDHH